MAQFTAWSASRLDDYTTCPLMAKLKHLDKLCTNCFEGQIKGGFDGKPAVCTKCHREQEKGPALVRGDEIGNALDNYLLGKKRSVPDTIRHKEVVKLVKDARDMVKASTGRPQMQINLTREWKPWTGAPWAPEVWFRGRMDFLYTDKDRARVIDWKTGGVDKSSGAVRAQDKYDDQLMLYNIAALSILPGIQEVTAALVFLDCKEPHKALVERDGLHRKDLVKAQKAMTKKALPMLSDTTFAPRANFSCTWCGFASKRGGPCPF